MAATALTAALLRSAASRIVRASPPPLAHSRRHLSRYARPGGYARPPPPPTDSPPVSRYARPGGYAAPPRLPVPPPTAAADSSRFSRYARHGGATPPTTAAARSSITKDVAARNNSSTVAAGSEALVERAKAGPKRDVVVSRYKDGEGAGFLMIGAGYVFFSFVKPTAEEPAKDDAAARHTPTGAYVSAGDA